MEVDLEEVNSLMAETHEKFEREGESVKEGEEDEEEEIE